MRVPRREVTGGGRGSEVLVWQASSFCCSRRGVPTSLGAGRSLLSGRPVERAACRRGATNAMFALPLSFEQWLACATGA